ncbi:MAG: hypothetical protein ACREQD_01385, partial [Candidatus Binataceae bacterium]
MIFCLLAAIGTGAPAFAQTASGASAAAPAAPLTDPNLAPARIQEFQNGIPVGTKITMANWEQYKSFMTDGLVEL